MKNTNAKGTNFARRAEKKAEVNARRTAEAQKRIDKKVNGETAINLYARKVMREYLAGLDYGYTLDTLASIITHTRLRSLIKTTGDVVTYGSMKSDIEHNKAERRRMALEESENCYIIKNNQKTGEKECVCVDYKQDQEIMKYLREHLAVDGCDLVQTVSCELLSLIKKAPKNADEDYLLKSFEVYYNKFYKNGKVKPFELWDKTLCNGIDKAFSSCSEYIKNLKSVKAGEVLYTELECEVEDPFTGEKEIIYLYNRATELSAEITLDGNGAEFAITSNEEYDKLVRSVPKLVGLDKQEEYIYYKHIIGYWDKNSKSYIHDSLQAIADKKKVSIQRIKKQYTSMRKKVGAHFGIEDTDGSKIAIEITAYNYNTGEFVGAYASIGDASKALNIAKSKISEVINGKRRQTGGYYFSQVK